MKLGEKWGVPPWELEAAPADWVHKALAMYTVEAQVRQAKSNMR